MRTLLIDDSGTLTDSASPALRADLSALGTGSDFTDYCIRNLGFVAVASNDTSVHVRLRPTVVSPIAFAGLMYWLGENMGKRVMLSVLDGEWSHRMIANTRDAMASIPVLVRAAQFDRGHDFLARPRDPMTLPNAHPFRALLRLHKELAHAFSNNQKSALFTIADDRLHGRYTISTADGNLSNLIMGHVGDGHASAANYWLKRSIGQRMSDLPDTALGSWTTEAHLDVAKSGRIRLDDLDLVIEWPNEGRQRYVYQRLLLPLQHDADGHAVLCATFSDRSINLRAECV
jgi:hypothetical protein